MRCCCTAHIYAFLQVLGGFVGPTFQIQLKPVSCPIYADPVTGRSYISFVDCDPAQLIIRTTPRKHRCEPFSALVPAGCYSLQDVAADYQLQQRCSYL
jgi:hypothetical protein